GLSGRATRLGVPAAAAERGELAAARAPLADAAAEHRARVHPCRAQHARRQRRARAALADGDDRSAADEAVLGRLAHVAVRHVVGPGNEAGVALVRLAYIEHLDLTRGEQALELVERDGLDALAPAALLPPREVEDADRVQ